MKPKAYVLDIDDTILDFIGHLYHIHNMLHGTDYKPSCLKEWKLPDDLKYTFEKYRDWLFVSQPILPGVQQKLWLIRKKGYKLILMTARPEKSRPQTEFNLALNGVHYDELFFNKNKSLKMNRLAEKYDIEVFADDKTYTVNKVKTDTDIPRVYLIDLSSNRKDLTEKGVKRIKSIKEIK